ncbi:Helicase associated domain protein [Pseudomonadales bacterium]|nr:Helicase associated domain protein [Pseudomonadales bacterium]
MATFEQFRSTFPEDSNEKGEAFEVFLAEWMFKNHPSLSSQFKKVWMFSDWPKAWSATDIGTDLIAEDQHGKICAIQAKFYKETSTIPKSDIDSFLSDTNRAEVDYRLLIATTDGLGKNAINAIEGQEKPVQSFTLKDFIEPFEWPESLGSLEEYQPREPHQPRPHQVAAIDDVTSKIESRGQLLMACGTGKTLTGQRIAEKLESKSTLVLLPSLLLLSKTVKDWVSEREQDFIFLPVCSDKSVTKQTDEIAVNDSELCFRSTTDTKEIADFLKRSENKVIFSTYQSSPQIAEAFKKHRLKPFDLILADEAHRCAGKISSEYSTVLSQDLIPAHKRLFMTATPRTYTSRIKNKAKDAELEMVSMDDESIFGPILHRLTFGQAIANDPPLLTDYRVLVVGVNDAMCKEMVETRAFVKTESGLEDDARSIATQLGLSKAVKDYDLKRVISFHSRVKLARDFASSFLEFQSDLKPEHKPEGKISYSHVSGAMPTSQRSKELRALGALEHEDRYLLGNARCLSEGVDVPALDGVAFVDPRRSEIDIIQAVGRAIRLSEGKEIGTIIIPVFISESDDPDEVLSTSEFDQVWKVVNALRSHDESLGEMLDGYTRKLGRKGRASLNTDKIILKLPKTIGSEFANAFESKLVETTTDSWEFQFGLLQRFFDEQGHAFVPVQYKLDGNPLGAKVSYWRGRVRQLGARRKALLDSVNFVWNAVEYQWKMNFHALMKFHSTFGHTNVPRKYQDKDIKLGVWVLRQRQEWADLDEEKMSMLLSLSFEPTPIASAWSQNYELLREYHSQFGHTTVPRLFTIQEKPLGHWVSTQRAKFQKGILTNAQIKLLDNLDFAWNKYEAQWLEKFQDLLDYKQKVGDTNVPLGYISPSGALGTWVQRQKIEKESMPPEHLSKLIELDFDWSNILEKKWDEGLEAAEAFYQIHGHFRPRDNHLFAGDRKLNLWLGTQKINFKKGKLSAERAGKLMAIGLDLSV